jgi:hypothetical protein
MLRGLRLSSERAIFVLASLLAVWAAISFFTGASADLGNLSSEYGGIETLSILVIVVCFALFCDAYNKGHGALRYAAGALALLAATAFVREVDVKNLPGPQWYHWIAERGLQEILFVGMSLLILAYLWRHRKHSRDLLELLTNWYAWPLFAAGALVLLSQYIERRAHNLRLVFLEEIAELLGYLFLAVAALRHHARVNTPSDCPTSAPVRLD